MWGSSCKKNVFLQGDEFVSNSPVKKKPLIVFSFGLEDFLSVTVHLKLSKIGSGLSQLLFLTTERIFLGSDNTNPLLLLLLFQIVFLNFFSPWYIFLSVLSSSPLPHASLAGEVGKLSLDRWEKKMAHVSAKKSSLIHEHSYMKTEAHTQTWMCAYKETGIHLYKI